MSQFAMDANSPQGNSSSSGADHNPGELGGLLPARKGLLHRNMHHNQVNFECLYSMYRDEHLCDVVLVASGREIQAHKVILASTSTYFYFKFSKNKHLGLPNRIEMDTITFGTLSTVLCYLYSSEVFIDQGNVEELLAAAYSLALTDLQSACCEFLKSNLSNENCVSSMNMAKRYKCQKLISEIMNYISDNFSDVCNQDEYLNLTYEQIVELITSDDLFTAEENVLESILSWVRRNIPHRKRYIFTLLSHVRISLLSLESLTVKLDKEQWLTSDPDYNAFIGKMFQCFFLGRQATLFSKYRLSSKLLVTVGITSENCLCLEMLDFEKNEWLSWPDILENCKKLRTIIYGLKLYYVDKCNMKWCNFSNPRQVTWSNCNVMLENCQISRVVGVHNDLIYSIGKKEVQQKVRQRNVQTKTYEYITTTIEIGILDLFDSSSGTWKRIQPMPNNEYDVGLVSSNGYLYAVAGQSSSGNPSNTIHCYILEKNSWRSIPPMSISRSNPGLASIGENLYVIGGKLSQGYSKQVETFNHVKQSWSFLPDMNVAREAPGALTINDQIFVVGGYNREGGYLDSVEVYSPQQNSWTMLPTSMNKGKSHVAVALVDKTKIKLNKF